MREWAVRWDGGAGLGAVVVEVARTEDVLAAGTGSLTAAERRRIDAVTRPDVRRDLLAARLLARTVVARRLGVEPGGVRIEQRCATCGQEGHGAPTVVSPVDRPGHVSWSRRDGWVVAVAAGAPVGVDLEPYAAGPRIRILLSELDPAWADRDPEEALTAWTCAEAWVKAGGGDLESGLQRVAAGPGLASGPGWSVASGSVGTDLRISVVLAHSDVTPSPEPVTG